MAGYELSKQYGIKLTHVMDREGDCSDVFNYAEEFEQRAIIRSVHNRNAIGQGFQGKLWDTDSYEHHEFVYREVRDPLGNKATARCRLAWQKVELNGVTPPLYAVHIKSAETGIEVEWLLLTNIPVNSHEDANRVVDGYVFRWRIEEFHK
jgi:hypothetical protein